MEELPTTDLGCPWPTPVDVPSLAAGEVHVWCAAINVDEQAAADLLVTLSKDEEQRAAHYLLDRSRRRFIACRAAQRMILARYLTSDVGWASARHENLGGLKPTLRDLARELVFDYSPLGKPTLAAGSDPSGRLKFNVSNSGDMAIIAVALDRELGADVERIRDNLDHHGLAQRYFASEERDKLRRLPEGERLAGFFDCWTRKEAFLKAIGKGLTYPLDRAIVSVGRAEPCRLLSLDGDESAASAWSLLPLHPAPGYVAAIAMPGSALKMLVFCWEA